MLKGNEIRKLYLDFFKDKHQHTIVESSSLVPDNPTVLLTTAGMLQFLPIFLGVVKSPYEPARATSCQKCARAGGKDSDIENVGRTPRHHTFHLVIIIKKKLFHGLGILLLMFLNWIKIDCG